jgi:mono/diheme cytochrome c family protein
VINRHSLWRAFLRQRAENHIQNGFLPALVFAEHSQTTPLRKPFMMKSEYVLSMLVIGFLFIAIAGCNMNSRGEQLFRNGLCKECHTIKGKGGASGPNLTVVGSRRTREYIIEQIKNPKSHNPNSEMPSFSEMPEQDINDLADYLSHLK